MDPFMVNLAKIVHEERMESYTKRNQLNEMGVSYTQVSWLQQLKEMFASVAKKASVNKQAPVVKSAPRG